MASSEKLCLYEVLGLNRDCTTEEIRSAYRKLALQRHPDKLVQSGVSEAEATTSFQELVNAYEVLSDPRERAWYDSHRSQILFSSSSSSGSTNTVVFDLFPFFSNSLFSGYTDTGEGFYKVYADLFDKIYSNELNFSRKMGLGLPREAPLMGNLQSPYAQVTAFYNYWLGFVSVMDFCWVDQYDAMAGPNRKSRRVMEDENKKLRKKAKKEYNDTVRGLAEFVKKRDKRVIDMQMKRNEELERKRKEEAERKKKMERERAERLKAYEEPEWAKAVEIEDAESEEQDEKTKWGHEKELYCVACGKKFKSEKQWKNHEQSKKHKEKVAEFREAFLEEEKESEDEEEADGEKELLDADSYRNVAMPADFVAADLQERFRSSLGLQEDDNVIDVESSEEEYFVDIDVVCNLKGINEELGLGDDDDADTLEALISGQKSRNFATSVCKSKASATKPNTKVNPDDMDFMDYNKTKGTRRKKGNKRERERGKKNNDTVKVDAVEAESHADVNNGYGDTSHLEKSPSHGSPENQSNDQEGDTMEQNDDFSKAAANKKGTMNRDANSKSKKASKGRKQKVTSKPPSNVCETCREEFDSRNKLHKHLSDTGHASLKYR